MKKLLNLLPVECCSIPKDYLQNRSIRERTPTKRSRFSFYPFYPVYYPVRKDGSVDSDDVAINGTSPMDITPVLIDVALSPITLQRSSSSPVNVQRVDISPLSIDDMQSINERTFDVSQIDIGK